MHPLRRPVKVVHFVFGSFGSARRLVQRGQSALFTFTLPYQNFGHAAWTQNTLGGTCGAGFSFLQYQKQKKMATFSSFRRLPAEIQEAIWKAAIPPPRPTVYPVMAEIRQENNDEDEDEDEDEDGTPEPDGLWRAHLINSTKDGRSNNDFLTTLSSLLVCCKHASSIAAAAYQQNKPKFPLSVRDLPHEIDGGCDLLMFRQGWQMACLQTGRRPADRAPEPILHNFAVLWPGPELTTPFWVSISLYNILSLWEDLQTFYVVVDPKHLAPQPWPPNASQSWATAYTVRDRQVLSAFLRYYQQGYEKQEPNVFYERGKEYFEVPTEVVGQAGALEPAAKVLFDAWDLLNGGIRYEPETVIKRCLILSWREE